MNSAERPECHCLHTCCPAVRPGPLPLRDPSAGNSPRDSRSPPLSGHLAISPASLWSLSSFRPVAIQSMEVLRSLQLDWVFLSRLCLSYALGTSVSWLITATSRLSIPRQISAFRAHLGCKLPSTGYQLISAQLLWLPL